MSTGSHIYRPTPAALLLMVGAVVVLLAAPDPAAAFQRTTTCDESGRFACREGEAPKPIFWPTRCVQYRINEQGSDQFERSEDGGDIEVGDRLRQLVRDGFATWNEVGCSDFQMLSAGLTEASKSRYLKEKGFEGNENLVVWRDDSWPYTSQSAFALTSVTFHTGTGRIYDADLEFNTANYEFAALEDSEVDEPGARVDLMNALVHEIGHFAGFSHARDPDATMYGEAPLGEVSKRTLHQDDIDGLCQAYAAPADETQAATCEEPEDFRPPPEGETGSDAGPGTGAGQRADAGAGGIMPDIGPRPDTGSTTGGAGSAGSSDGRGEAYSGSTGCMGCGGGGRAGGGMLLVLLLAAASFPLRQGGN